MPSFVSLPDFHGSSFCSFHVTYGVSSSATTEEQTVSSDKVSSEEELLWKSICGEASRLQSESRDPSLDRDTVMVFVSPVTGKMESCDNADYFRAKLFYQTELAHQLCSVSLHGCSRL
ncbi:unnamed protein product [Cuscuta epithymum]|uniref:Uncharacterized protein n=1 Tax=Cuscuta epithymum TaxID=186058 RepID=A0AAV0CGZ3_9ASTE|nr:unnamed protein product [Cuscuta epithymum]